MGGACYSNDNCTPTPKTNTCWNKRGEDVHMNCPERYRSNCDQGVGEGVCWYSGADTQFPAWWGSGQWEGVEPVPAKCSGTATDATVQCSTSDASVGSCPAGCEYHPPAFGRGGRPGTWDFDNKYGGYAKGRRAGGYCKQTFHDPGEGGADAGGDSQGECTACPNGSVVVPRDANAATVKAYQEELNEPYLTAIGGGDVQAVGGGYSNECCHRRSANWCNVYVTSSQLYFNDDDDYPFGSLRSDLQPGGTIGTGAGSKTRCTSHTTGCEVCLAGEYEKEGNCISCKQTNADQGVQNYQHFECQGGKIKGCKDGYGPEAGQGEWVDVRDKCYPECEMGGRSHRRGSKLIYSCQRGEVAEDSYKPSHTCTHPTQADADDGDSRLWMWSWNDGDCSACGLGQMTADAHGNFTEWDGVKCEDCPAGHWCPHTYQQIACGLGKYSSEVGATENVCIDCPAGTYLDVAGSDDVADCISCPAGKYLNREGGTAESNCINCPAGKYFSGKCYTDATYEDELLDNGNPKYTDETACLSAPGTCTAPAGSDDAAVAACAAVTGTDLDDATVCEAVGPCTYANPVWRTGWGSVEEDCVPCPAGKYVDLTGSDEAADCLDCEAGHWCEAGSYSARQNACPAGTFLDVEGGEEAGPGWRGVGETIVCINCPAGTYSGVGSDESADCNIRCDPGKYRGYVCKDPKELPYRTPDNCAQYDEMRPCQENGCEFIMDTECIDCPVGTYSNGKCYTDATYEDEVLDSDDNPMYTDFNACTSAGDRTYEWQRGGQQSCTTCPAGKYFGGKCYTDATYEDEVQVDSDGNPITDQDTCTFAGDPTYVWRPGGSDDATDCIDCPAGTYFSGKCYTDATYEYEVLGGDDKPMYTDETSCLSAPGTCTATDNTDDAAVDACTGVVALNDKTACEGAGACTYAKPVWRSGGGSSSDDCIPCGDGKYSSGKCYTHHTYGNEHTYTEKNECITNTATCIATEAAYAAEAEVCSQLDRATLTLQTCEAAGACTYATGWLSGGKGEGDCIECPVGKYLDSTGGDEASDCISCPAGKYVGDRGMVDATDCIDCEAGYWCEEGSITARGRPGDESRVHSPCPFGKYFSGKCYTNATYGDEVRDSDGNRMDQGTCEADGKVWNNQNSICYTSATYEDELLDGNDNPMYTDFTACTSAVDGNYVWRPGGGSEEGDCVPCPAGTYLDQEGGIAESDCILCGVGKYFSGKCYTDATYEDELLDNGNPKYTDETACLSAPGTCTAPAGSDDAAVDACNAVVALDDATACEEVGACTYANPVWRPGGGSEEGDCIECPVGKYLDSTGGDESSDCITCPAGTYVDVPGSVDVSDCIECGTGKYVDSPGSDAEADCIECPVGKYLDSTGGDEASDCITCPAGTYIDVRGSVDVSDCISCPAGKYFSGKCYTDATYGDEVLDSDGNRIDQYTCEADGKVWNNQNSICYTSATYGDELLDGDGIPKYTNVTSCNEAGYTWAAGVGTKVGDCINCPAGTYSFGKCYTAIDGDSEPRYERKLSCENEGYVWISGGRSVADCIDCDYGKYSDVVGSSTEGNCIDCGAGKYSKPVCISSTVSTVDESCFNKTTSSSGCTENIDAAYNECKYRSSVCHFCPQGETDTSTGSNECEKLSSASTYINDNSGTCVGAGEGLDQEYCPGYGGTWNPIEQATSGAIGRAIIYRADSTEIDSIGGGNYLFSNVGISPRVRAGPSGSGEAGENFNQNLGSDGEVSGVKYIKGGDQIELYFTPDEPISSGAVCNFYYSSQDDGKEYFVRRDADNAELCDISISNPDSCTGVGFCSDGSINNQPECVDRGETWTSHLLTDSSAEEAEEVTATCTAPAGSDDAAVAACAAVTGTDLDDPTVCEAVGVGACTYAPAAPGQWSCKYTLDPGLSGINDMKLRFTIEAKSVREDQAKVRNILAKQVTGDDSNIGEVRTDIESEKYNVFVDKTTDGTSIIINTFDEVSDIIFDDIYSNNGYSKQKAKSGDIVTIKFHSPDVLLKATCHFIIQGDAPNDADTPTGAAEAKLTSVKGEAQQFIRTNGICDYQIPTDPALLIPTRLWFRVKVLDLYNNVKFSNWVETISKDDVTACDESSTCLSSMCSPRVFGDSPDLSLSTDGRVRGERIASIYDCEEIITDGSAPGAEAVGVTKGIYVSNGVSTLSGLNITTSNADGSFLGVSGSPEVAAGDKVTLKFSITNTNRNRLKYPPQCHFKVGDHQELTSVPADPVVDGSGQQWMCDCDINSDVTGGELYFKIDATDEYGNNVLNYNCGTTSPSPSPCSNFAEAQQLLPCEGLDDETCGDSGGCSWNNDTCVDILSTMISENVGYPVAAVDYMPHTCRPFFDNTKFCSETYRNIISERCDCDAGQTLNIACAAEEPPNCNSNGCTYSGSQPVIGIHNSDTDQCTIKKTWTPTINNRCKCNGSWNDPPADQDADGTAIPGEWMKAFITPGMTPLVEGEVKDYKPIQVRVLPQVFAPEVTKHYNMVNYAEHKEDMTSMCLVAPQVVQDNWCESIIKEARNDEIKYFLTRKQGTDDVARADSAHFTFKNRYKTEWDDDDRKEPEILTYFTTDEPLKKAQVKYQSQGGDPWERREWDDCFPPRITGAAMDVHEPDEHENEGWKTWLCKYNILANDDRALDYKFKLTDNAGREMETTVFNSGDTSKKKIYINNIENISIYNQKIVGCTAGDSYSTLADCETAGGIWTDIPENGEYKVKVGDASPDTITVSFVTSHGMEDLNCHFYSKPHELVQVDSEDDFFFSGKNATKPAKRNNEKCYTSVTYENEESAITDQLSCETDRKVWDPNDEKCYTSVTYGNEVSTIRDQPSCEDGENVWVAGDDFSWICSYDVTEDTILAKEVYLGLSGTDKAGNTINYSRGTGGGIMDGNKLVLAPGQDPQHISIVCGEEGRGILPERYRDRDDVHVPDAVSESDGSNRNTLLDDINNHHTCSSTEDLCYGACEVCQDGKYSDSSTNLSYCIDCPKGTYYGGGEGGKSVGACTNTGAGWGSSIHHDRQEECVAGKYSVGNNICRELDRDDCTKDFSECRWYDGTKRTPHRRTHNESSEGNEGGYCYSECISCPQGKYSTINGSTTRDNCLPCDLIYEKGRTTSSIGGEKLSDCDACYIGYHVNNGMCKKCPVGKTTTRIHAISDGDSYCFSSDLSSQIDDSEKYHEDYKEGECCLGMKKQTVPIMKEGNSYPIFQRKCQLAERWVCNDLKKEGERVSDCAGSELPTTDAHNRSLVQVRHKTCLGGCSSGDSKDINVPFHQGDEKNQITVKSSDLREYMDFLEKENIPYGGLTMWLVENTELEEWEDNYVDECSNNQVTGYTMVTESIDEDSEKITITFSEDIEIEPECLGHWLLIPLSCPVCNKNNGYCWDKDKRACLASACELTDLGGELVGCGVWQKFRCPQDGCEKKCGEGECGGYDTIKEANEHCDTIPECCDRCDRDTEVWDAWKGECSELSCPLGFTPGSGGSCKLQIVKNGYPTNFALKNDVLSCKTGYELISKGDGTPGCILGNKDRWECKRGIGFAKINDGDTCCDVKDGRCMSEPVCKEGTVLVDPPGDCYRTDGPEGNLVGLGLDSKDCIGEWSPCLSDCIDSSYRIIQERVGIGKECTDPSGNILTNNSKRSCKGRGSCIKYGELLCGANLNNEIVDDTDNWKWKWSDRKRSKCNRYYTGPLQECLRVQSGDITTRQYCNVFRDKCMGNTNPNEDIDCYSKGLIPKNNPHDIILRGDDPYDTCCNVLDSANLLKEVKDIDIHLSKDEEILSSMGVGETDLDRLIKSTR